MNKFFVSNEVYEDRIAICKSCEFYQSLLGNCSICKCFMKVKARLAPMECAAKKKKWEKTTKIETPENLPQEMIEEVFSVWENIKTGRAKNYEQKSKMIQLYNTIYMTNYSVGTSCGSCLNTCFDGIKKLYNKYKTE